MKTQIYSTNGENKGEIDIPEVFNAQIRDIDIFMDRKKSSNA